MKTICNYLALSLVVAIIFGCDKTGPAAQSDKQDPELAESPYNPDNPQTPALYPQIRITLSASDQAMRDASNNFGIKVFGLLSQKTDSKKDIVFSPLSLSLALAMAAEGAESDTYKQFTEVLGWGNLTREEIGAFYAKMIVGLEEADRMVSFLSSNSLWAAKDLSVKVPYTELLAKSFSAESYSVDFSLSETKDRINGWCAEKTNGKIQKMLEALDAETRLVLINALLFKAPWCCEWEIEVDRPFYGADNASKKDYLHTNGQFSYQAIEGMEVVGIPYGNGAYELDVILPEKDRSLKDVLTSSLPGIVRTLPEAVVDLSLPKFSLEYSTEDALPACLQALGLGLPFSSARADFSGISSEKLYISKVIQKTRVDVTENGTEFAAVSLVGMEKALPGAPMEKRIINLDRPFAYIIRETSTNTILLMGTLSE